MKYIQLILFAVAGIIGVYTSAHFLGTSKTSDIPIYSEVPEFNLIDENSRHFGKQDLLGKIWIANFFFTSCPHVCPAINGRVASLVKRTRANDQVHFVSVTIDPETDTPPKLLAYAKKFGADCSRWHFLTGKLEEIKSLSNQGFKLGLPDEAELHTTRLVLVDRLGRIRGYYSGQEDSDLQRLEYDMQKLSRRG